MQPLLVLLVAFVVCVVIVAKAFYWPNDQGEQWSVVLRRNARKEFEQGRYETDPIVVARMLVVGRDCLMELQHRFNAIEESIKNRVTKTRNDRNK